LVDILSGGAGGDLRMSVFEHLLEWKGWHEVHGVPFRRQGQWSWRLHVEKELQGQQRCCGWVEGIFWMNRVVAMIK